MASTGLVAIIASEEDDEPVCVNESTLLHVKVCFPSCVGGLLLPGHITAFGSSKRDSWSKQSYMGGTMMQVHLNDNGRYVVVFDPLDGSRNIECSIPTGTIFGVYALPEGYQPGAADSHYCWKCSCQQAMQAAAVRTSHSRNTHCQTVCAPFRTAGQSLLDAVLRRGSEQLASG